MAILIDGYNLVHALGLIANQAGPSGLERARDRLLELLHAALGERSADATVVFDSHKRAPKHPAEQEFHGIHVHFSRHPENADDVIEQLIRSEPAPKQLTVVSDDHRIQRAGRKRSCHVVGCVDFIEELQKTRAPKPIATDVEKGEGLSEAERKALLREFADLDNSPEMKHLSDPPEFQM
jgi:predicted RNA-binding protein with PIN domain